MTDTVTTDDFFAKYQAKRQQELERLANVQPEYLQAIASYGITKADIEFNGCGDEGQIENIDADGTDELDKVRVRPEHEYLVEDCCIPRKEGKTVYDLIETFVYGTLDRSDYDWINNDGGFGTVHIEPTKGVVNVDLNIRISDVENHSFDMSNLEEKENA